ncbi:hypothetical protein ACP70R_024229 [Stipagrostis hirtigluma subsp. patula]
MESTGAVTRPAKRPRTTPSAEQAGGVDLISSLGDDHLVRILELVGSTKAAVRTGALSRRWRGLWTRVRALRFVPSPEFNSSGDAERYAAFVSGVLAQRARPGVVVEHLEISYRAGYLRRPGEEHLLPSSIGAAQGWARFAARQAVRSFTLDLFLPLPRDYHNDDSSDDDNDDDGGEGGNNGSINGKQKHQVMIVLDEFLPSATKLETMLLSLGGARLRLPGGVVFSSLTDLSLEVEHIKLAAGSGHLLAQFLSSSCCPRLKKLYMWGIKLGWPAKDVVLDAGELSELLLVEVEGVALLKLGTPSLRALHIDHFSVEALTISAPRLEELTFLHSELKADRVDGDLSCVGSLELDSHDETSVFLLKRCTSATRLDVSLESPEGADTMRGRVAQLPHVTSLIVHLSPRFKRHTFGDGLASLFTRFSNLTFLGLHLGELDGSTNKWYELYSTSDEDSNFNCDHPDNWKSNEIVLAHLQEAEFTGLTGMDCEFRFLQFVLASTTKLQKVGVSFKPNCFQEGRSDDLALRLLGSGTWTACCDAYRQCYEWRPCP